MGQGSAAADVARIRPIRLFESALRSMRTRWMRQETTRRPGCTKTGSLRTLKYSSSGRPIASGGIFLVEVLFCAVNSAAYSVLTHQELIDLAWNDSIRPVLLARFPNATEEQLREAHAYQRRSWPGRCRHYQSKSSLKSLEIGRSFTVNDHSERPQISICCRKCGPLEKTYSPTVSRRNASQFRE